MKKLIIILAVLSSLACNSNDPEPYQTTKPTPHFLNNSEQVAEPYDLEFKLEGTKKDGYKIVVEFKPHGGSYTASPLSNNDFTGLFTISLEENDLLSLVGDYEEYPPSEETTDSFSGQPVNWVREHTCYKRLLKLKTEQDFEVSGLVSFTIEPLCTFEEIPFTLSYQSGELTIKS